MTTQDIAKQEAYIFETLNNRAKELLAIPQVDSKYKSFSSEYEAKQWILSQALATLMLSPEERQNAIKN